MSATTTTTLLAQIAAAEQRILQIINSENPAELAGTFAKELVSPVLTGYPQSVDLLLRLNAVRSGGGSLQP
jgi:hypothetical protein